MLTLDNTIINNDTTTGDDMISMDLRIGEGLIDEQPGLLTLNSNNNDNNDDVSGENSVSSDIHVGNDLFDGSGMQSDAPIPLTSGNFFIKKVFFKF